MPETRKKSQPVALEIVRVDEPLDAQSVVRHYVAMCLEQIGVTGNRTQDAA